MAVLDAEGQGPGADVHMARILDEFVTVMHEDIPELGIGAFVEMLAEGEFGNGAGFRLGGVLADKVEGQSPVGVLFGRSGGACVEEGVDDWGIKRTALGPAEAVEELCLLFSSFSLVPSGKACLCRH